MYIYVCIYVYVYICTYLSKGICIYIRTYFTEMNDNHIHYMHSCICIFYVHLYICIYIYIHIYTYRLAALAERGEHPRIHVFDLRSFRRKKTIIAPDTLFCKVFIYIYINQLYDLFL
jgi:hypothetical protein